VTGTSVLAFKYRDGIIMAADMLGKKSLIINLCSLINHACIGSYGSLARFRDIKRLYPVGESTIVGASGDLSDYQYIQHLLDSLM
jgi:20S proteasome subunit beta 7